jgi:hypothetical protein
MTPAQDAVVATIGARDVQVGFELGWVGNGDLEEHDPIGVRDVVVGQFLGRFLAVLGQVASIRLVRDDANRARPGVTEQPLGSLIEVHRSDTQFERPDEPRRKRYEDDAADEAGGDLDPFGTLDDIRDGGVDEHRRNEGENRGTASAPGVMDRQGNSDGRRSDQYQDTVA